MSATTNERVDDHTSAPKPKPSTATTSSTSRPRSARPGPRPRRDADADRRPVLQGSLAQAQGRAAPLPLIRRAGRSIDPSGPAAVPQARWPARSGSEGGSTGVGRGRPVMAADGLDGAAAIGRRRRTARRRRGRGRRPGRPAWSRAAAAAGSGQRPTPRPARSAAPRAVDSAWGLLRSGRPSRSAWNWRNGSDRAIPPSTRRSRQRDGQVGVHGVDQVGDLEGDALPGSPGRGRRPRWPGSGRRGSPGPRAPSRGPPGRSGRGRTGRPSRGRPARRGGRPRGPRRRPSGRRGTTGRPPRRRRRSPPGRTAAGRRPRPAARVVTSPRVEGTTRPPVWTRRNAPVP